MTVHPGDTISTTFFSTAVHESVHMRPVLSDQYTDWALPVFLVSFIILAWIQFFYQKKFHQFIKGLFSIRTVNQLIREGNIMNKWMAIGLGVIFLSSLTLFLFQVIENLFSPSDLFLKTQFSLLIIALLIVGLILIKLFIIRTTGLLFNTNNASSKYIINAFVFNLNLGVFLLPIIIIMAYSPINGIIYPGIGFLALIFVYRLFRGVLIGITYTNFSQIYIILYLCTVEILPTLIITKIAMKYLIDS